MKLTWDGWKLVSVEPLNQDEQEINEPVQVYKNPI
jgi:hypothetical protein